MDRYRTPMHWVGWGSIALLALACFAPWVAVKSSSGLAQFGLLDNEYLSGGAFLLAFVLAAAVGLLVRKRALTIAGGLGALAMTLAIAYGAPGTMLQVGHEANLTWGVLLAGVGAAGLVFMPWRMRNPWA